MKPSIIYDEAEVELWEAVGYYEEKAPGLGLDLEAETRDALAEIQEAPRRWPRRRHGTRRRLVQPFPYAIYYIELPDALWVVAFAHTHRKPYYWRGRTEDRPMGSAPSQMPYGV